MTKVEVHFCQPSLAQVATGGPLLFAPQFTDARGGWLGVPNDAFDHWLPLAQLPSETATGQTIFAECWPGLSLTARAVAGGENGLPCLVAAQQMALVDPEKVRLAKNGPPWLAIVNFSAPLLIAFATDGHTFAATSAQGLVLAGSLAPRTWAVPLWVPVQNRPDQPTHALNVTDWALAQFRQHYRFTEKYDDRAWANGEQVDRLFNFREFEHCRVVPDFAGDLRALIELGEGREVKQLAQSIHTPNAATAKSFDKVSKVFAPIQRRFERGGRALCLGPESYAVISAYFAGAARAHTELADFFADPNFDQPLREINKIDIFYYCLAVLTDPTYQTEAAYHLQRDVPRLPFYEDFWHWRERGQQLTG